MVPISGILLVFSVRADNYKGGGPSNSACFAFIGMSCLIFVILLRIQAFSVFDFLKKYLDVTLVRC